MTRCKPGCGCRGRKVVSRALSDVQIMINDADCVDRREASWSVVERAAFR